MQPNQISEYELFKVKKYLSDVDETSLQTILEDYLVNAKDRDYCDFKQSLLSLIGINLCSEYKKEYSFYFLITIDNQQKILSYSTNIISSRLNKKSIMELLTYLQYCSEYSLNPNLKFYCISASNDEYYEIDELFKNLNYKTTGNKPLLYVLLDFSKQHFYKTISALSGILL